MIYIKLININNYIFNLNMLPSTQFKLGSLNLLASVHLVHYIPPVTVLLIMHS